MRNFVVLLFVVAMLFGVITGCTAREQPTGTSPAPEEMLTPTPPPTPTTVPTPPPTPVPPPTEEPEPPYRNPLNGAPLTEPYTARPFAVMVNNLREAQPQCGISQADVIYEVLAEGGVTRMMAIFSDIQSVEHLGSIRSIRPYYIDISMGYGAVTIHAGGSPDAYRRIRSDKIENLDGVNGVYPTTLAFYYDQTRRYSGYAQEHTLFTEGKTLYDYSEKQSYALTVEDDYDAGLHFCKDAAPENGSTAKQIHIAFTGNDKGKCTELVYQESSGLYTATQWLPVKNGIYKTEYIDGNSNTQLSFRNVIALTANTKVLDESGRLQIDLIGTGEGYFACGGKCEKIIWERDSISDHFHYYHVDGSELQVSVGSTYIGILSDGNAIQSTIEFQ